MWLCAHWFVAVGTVPAVWSAATSPGGHPGGVGMAALGVVAWLAIAAQLRWLLHQVGSFRWWTWVLFPVTLTTFGLLFAGSCLLSLGVRQVRWRGRVVPVSGAAAQESG